MRYHLQIPEAKQKRKLLEYIINHKGCWIVTSHRCNDSGYPLIYINGKILRAHRYMYQKHYGEIPQNLFVCHICGNPQCINPQHLKTESQKDNMQDMIRHGRSTRGEKNPTAKLTKNQVKKIRADKVSSHTILARKYGVGRRQISKIRKRESWGWLL